MLVKNFFRRLLTSSSHAKATSPIRERRAGALGRGIERLEDRTVPAGADLFANATVIPGSPIPYTDPSTDTTGFTAESGELEARGSSADRSAWWTFTPAVSGFYQIDTIGSNFDTMLVVGVGSSAAEATTTGRLAANDDAYGLLSRIVINLTAGTKYYIQQDGFGTAAGNVVLNLRSANGLLPDPLNPGQNMLSVYGTGGGDVIAVTRSAGGGHAVLGPGGPQAFAGPVSRVVVYAGGGNDTVTVAPDVTVPAMLFGEGGNDVLSAGGGPAVLVGGGGDDALTAGVAGAVLIGGAGADRLVGGFGAGLMIAGTVTFDADENALAFVLTQWTAASPYETRVNNLRTAGLQAGFTVFDDGAVDIVSGGLGLDWVFANRVGGVTDLVLSLAPNEFTDEL